MIDGTAKCHGIAWRCVVGYILVSKRQRTVRSQTFDPNNHECIALLPWIVIIATRGSSNPEEPGKDTSNIVKIFRQVFGAE